MNDGQIRMIFYRLRERLTLRMLPLILLVAVGAAWGQDTSQPPSAPTPQEPQQPASQQPQSTPDQSQEQQNPATEKDKDTSTNPVEQAAQDAAEKTKEITVEAAEATKDLGEKALEEARHWESGFLTGVFVPKGREITPLTMEERREIYLRQTLTSPGPYFKRMFAAGIDQARGSPPQWQGGIGGYGERFASREGQFIAANSLAALGNAKLGYETRYDQCNCSGLWPRTRHAIVRNFVTYDRSEHTLRPQWALYGGAFGGGMISAAWKPGSRNPFGQGAYAMIGQAGWGSLLNFFIEFAGEINRKLGGAGTVSRK